MKALLACAVILAACGGSKGIDSNEEARRAYLGLDESIGKSIELGFDGFNTANSANISAQNTTGTDTGMLVITGQVDQGSSDNKGMRLLVGMTDYSDGPFVVNDKAEVAQISYDTPADPSLQPALDMQLKNIPTGTLDGTLAGTYTMSGDIDGSVDLNLTFTGDLMDDGAGNVVRVPGSVHVTGTAVTPKHGTFAVDVTL